MNHSEQEMIVTEYSGRPIAPIVVVLIWIALMIYSGTHFFVYLIDKLCGY